MAVNSDLKVSTLLPESPNHENEIPNNLKDISASISSSDLEKATPNTTETLSIEPNLVTWTSPTDPRNPKNWPKTSKWLVTGIVSLFLFVTIMCSTVISPALPAIGADLHIENDAELQTAMSIYVLGYAFGPLFLAPLSELYGRVRVLQLSNVYFVIWSVVCGFARTKEQMIVARFMAGIGSSAPLGIGGGILSDVWHAAERAFGPLIGGFISQNLNWSWSFWIMAIVTTPPIILSFFVFRETYAPVILHRLAAKLRKETGNHDLYTIYDKERPSLPTRLRIALTRPTLMLFQQPIIQVWALFGAYSFGLLYIVLTTFPTLWIDQYGQSPSEAGLQCLWLGLGFTTGICIGGIFQDRIYVYLRKRYLQTSEEITHPPVAEHRLPLMIPSVLFMSIGLIIYGWTARAHTHWC
ncbi:putative Uncharacterized transporter [Glarea lozoyensis 74030]|uniref:Putative Uncharacterized transporter n=1 Tax=Glarea lozoyensis (strain ATCC 74030 / MF5533) TaxID=1104152 RepID=H0EJ80_GLAL7|nr:putative Uncharacterized transporter [Glarea lozoyensis 74030]